MTQTDAIPRVGKGMSVADLMKATPGATFNIVDVGQSSAALARQLGGMLIQFFDAAASIERRAITQIDIDAIPPEDRPTMIPLLVEFAAIQAEKKRRKVRFVPAQVVRRIKAQLFEDKSKPGFKLIFAGSDLSEFQKQYSSDLPGEAEAILGNCNTKIFLPVSH